MEILETNTTSKKENVIIGEKTCFKIFIVIAKGKKIQ